jgi:hypothetical protein
MTGRARLERRSVGPAAVFPEKIVTSALLLTKLRNQSGAFAGEGPMWNRQNGFRLYAALEARLVLDNPSPVCKLAERGDFSVPRGVFSALCRLQMHLGWSLVGLVSRVSRARG